MEKDHDNEVAEQLGCSDTMPDPHYGSRHLGLEVVDDL